jgi:hypothetical protein
MMGTSYFASNEERQAAQQMAQRQRDQEAARIADQRRQLAAKIIMATVDKIVNEIVRPGPKPEERECYEMAGELRALVPELENLAAEIIDVNDGVD